MRNNPYDLKSNVQNIDLDVVASFGDEWRVFNQSVLSKHDQQVMFDNYFSIFPWNQLPQKAIGFDAGCGSGRWAALVAPRVEHLYCIDPSNAIDIACKSLEHLKNCSFHRVSVDNLPFADESMDFGYSLGVLHHIPDPQRGLNDCVRKLKSGAPFLVYLYYAFDNQPAWFRMVWKGSDLIRKFISKQPFSVKYFLSQFIATVVYFPLARTALVLEKLGFSVHSFPLSAYRDKSFYTMRTDSLDRFGTKLEWRFTKPQIEEMLICAGLENIKFNMDTQFWCAVGFKK